MALLQRGCFCCELRTCVRIQAWIGLLIAVLNIGVGVFLLVVLFDLVPPEHLPEQLRTPKFPAGTKRTTMAAAIRTLKIQQAIAGSVTLLLGLINLSIDIAVIYGCRKENRRLIMPGLIWGAFGLLFMIALSIIAIISTPVKVAAIISVSAVPLLGISLYFWLHILSYYLELREEDKELKRQTL